MSTVMFFAVPKLFDARRGVLRGVRWLRGAGGGRAKGLFNTGVGGAAENGERGDELEFGFCFDVRLDTCAEEQK